MKHVLSRNELIRFSLLPSSIPDHYSTRHMVFDAFLLLLGLELWLCGATVCRQVVTAQ